MYNDNILISKAIDSFGKACGLLTASGAVSRNKLMEHFLHSDCVNAIREGNALYANSSPLALALCIAGELEASNDDKNEVAVLFEEYKWDTIMLWLAQTEMDIAIKTGHDILSLRSIVDAKQLQSLYDMYHIYYDTGVLIDEYYHLEGLRDEQ